MKQETPVPKSGLPPEDARKVLYASSLVFLAAGGLAAYLHFAHPSPAECIDANYYVRGSKRDRETALVQKESQIASMMQVAEADGVVEREEQNLIQAAADNLENARELHESCEPTRSDRTMELIAIVPAGVLSGMFAAGSAIQMRRRRDN